MLARDDWLLSEGQLSCVARGEFKGDRQDSHACPFRFLIESSAVNFVAHDCWRGCEGSCHMIVVEGWLQVRLFCIHFILRCWIGRRGSFLFSSVIATRRASQFFLIYIEVSIRSCIQISNIRKILLLSSAVSHFSSYWTVSFIVVRVMATL